MPRVAIESTNRFPMQIPPAEKARLMRAAALEQTSLKDFVLQNALRAADAVIQKAERLRLDEAQTRFLLDLLDHPPAPNDKLLAAARSLPTGP
ncbi:MAG: DUF1778 domain-containing protein [Candidatus Competibacteraceae bacterium]|nr:DUF1778 domain-containing protein [Candidatus Competibacteraceae bacterium]MBK8185396.1 DUF1778 domain-containing protein [Candidatus Competibacteraceae bacterium]